MGAHKIVWNKSVSGNNELYSNVLNESVLASDWLDQQIDKII